MVRTTEILMPRNKVSVARRSIHPIGDGDYFVIVRHPRTRKPVKVRVNFDAQKGRWVGDFYSQMSIADKNDEKPATTHAIYSDTALQDIHILYLSKYQITGTTIMRGVVKRDSYGDPYIVTMQGAELALFVGPDNKWYANIHKERPQSMVDVSSGEDVSYRAQALTQQATLRQMQGHIDRLGQQNRTLSEEVESKDTEIGNLETELRQLRNDSSTIARNTVTLRLVEDRWVAASGALGVGDTREEALRDYSYESGRQH